jgi:hypothetical protein
MRIRFGDAFIVVIAAFAAPASAHHSFAMFDNSRSVTLIGVVEKFQWTNPHSYLELDVDQGGGKTKHYTLEATSPNMMSRAGWTSRSVKVGERVTVIMSPLRNGQPGGLLHEVTFSNGKTLVNPVPNQQNYKRTP